MIFTVDAFVGNTTDWEKVCLGNLVGLPVTVIPTGFKAVSNPPDGGTQRRTAITTGIFASPNHDHVVRFMLTSICIYRLLTRPVISFSFTMSDLDGYPEPPCITSSYLAS